MKSLSNFVKSAISKTEMKKVKGGGQRPWYCDGYFMEYRPECDFI